MDVPAQRHALPASVLELQTQYDAMCKETGLAITTITVAVRTTLDDEARKDASLPSESLARMIEAGLYVPPAGIEVTVKRGKKNQFLNCAIFIVKTPENQATVKAFTNGTFHITGAKTFVACWNVAGAFVDVVLDATGMSLAIAEMTTLMVNSGCRAAESVNLDKLRGMIVGSSYDRDRHPALKARVGPFAYKTMAKPNAKKRTARVSKDKTYSVTALVFPTGSVIFCGAKTPDAMLSAHNSIVRNVITPRADDLALSNYAPKSKKARIADTVKSQSRAETTQDFYEALDLDALLLV